MIIRIFTRATIDDYVHLFREVYPDSEKLSSEYIEWLYSVRTLMGAWLG